VSTVQQIEHETLIEDKDHNVQDNSVMTTYRITRQYPGKFIIYRHERKVGYRRILTLFSNKVNRFKTSEDVARAINKNDIRFKNKRILAYKTPYGITQSVETDYFFHSKSTSKRSPGYPQMVGLVFVQDICRSLSSFHVGISKKLPRNPSKKDLNDARTKIIMYAEWSFIQKHGRTKTGCLGSTIVEERYRTWITSKQRNLKKSRGR
jgi:hypothetical protein